MFKHFYFCLMFLYNLNCINSDLKCNFHEFLDTSLIYTCELVSSSVNIEGGHMSGKTDADVRSIKFDGFQTDEIFDISQTICETYKNLEIVKLFSAGITDLRQDLFTECTNLKFLSLTSNKIREIPEDLLNSNSKLTTVSVEQNNLTTIPEKSLSNLRDLSDLNLNKNQIANLPANVFLSQTNLKTLKLNSNKIQIINPNWFRNLRNLLQLDLSNNLISTLADRTFKVLTNLQSLQLNQNKIAELNPNVFHNLNNLQELNLDFNRISHPAAEAFEPLTNLKKLSLGANTITDLENNIFGHLQNLEELKLWQNKLTDIHADSFGTHNNLILIDLEDNMIEAVDPLLIENLNSFRLFMDGNICYGGDLEGKEEMLIELKGCFYNYATPEYLSNLGTTNTISASTSDLTTTERIPLTSTTRERLTINWKTTRTTRSTTAFTTTQHTTTTNSQPRPTRLTTLKPTTSTRTTTTTYRPTTLSSLWNLLEPKYIPKCGQSKVKISTELSGNQVRHGAYPWTAALIRKDGQLFCGGILVNKNFVLTAAHCIEGKKKFYFFEPKDFFIMLGAHNVKQATEKGRITANVKAVHIHPDWNPFIEQYDADIAIIELEVEVTFNRFIQPICIPEPGSIPATKNQGFVVGFGKSEFADIQDIARLVHTPIHDNRKCHSSNDAYQLLLSHRGFCGGYGNGTGVCTGDSGSGLIVIHDGIYYLRGIVSASLNGPLNGCNFKTYSIFTDILEFTGWIKIGKDDKTLIQYLLERIRKCEAKEGTTKKGAVKPALEIKQTSSYDSSRVIFPDD